jgi:hypothetical protein
MDYDSSSNMAVVPAIAQGTFTSTQTSAALDTSLYNYKALTAVIYVGVGGITFNAGDAIKFTVTTSPDNNSDYVAATSDDVVLNYTDAVTNGLPDSSGNVLNFVALHASAAAYVVGIITKARYVKIAATFSGTHGSGTPIHVDWVFDHPMSAPYFQTQVTAAGDVI